MVEDPSILPPFLPLTEGSLRCAWVYVHRVRTPTLFASAGESEKYPIQREHVFCTRTYTCAYKFELVCTYRGIHVDTLLDLLRFRVEVLASTSCLIWSLTSARGSFLDQLEEFQFPLKP